MRELDNIIQEQFAFFFLGFHEHRLSIYSPSTTSFIILTNFSLRIIWIPPQRHGAEQCNRNQHNPDQIASDEL